MTAQKPFSTKSPDQTWDYIVIGSGMGGLSTAALLSLLGKKCLVLEQHYVPGGFTHTFKRKKWVWDVGVHAVGEVSDRAVVGRIMKAVTRGKLEWTSLGNIYDEFYYPDDFRIDFPGDRRQFEANLHTAFPGERAAIDEYLKRVRTVGASMKKYYLSRLLPTSVAALTDGLFAADAHRHLALRTKDVLDELTANDKLKTVLASQWGYYGSPPSRSSFAIHALVVKHFWHGGYYPVGGAKQIADAMMETIKDGGGWTRISSEVDEIVIENGRAVGVRLKDGGEVIRSKAVVSGAGGLGTVDRLLPAAYKGKRWAREIARLRPSPAHICLNIGFKGDIRKAGAGAANKWFYETWDPEKDLWYFDDPATEPAILYTSFPSLKDPKHEAGPEELHTGEVVTFVPWEAFEKWKDARWMRRGDDYEAVKKDISERVLKQLLRHMPGLEPFVAYTELSTPLSTEHFTRAPSGAIYGIEPTPERFANRWLRPPTPVKGLYLSGGDVATVGVVGAFVGGMLCAAAAEPRKALAFLRQATNVREHALVA
ncbi:MAG: NAD(P)/FAD-dependent oxidoreductase [Deltaproteobacteria bacterium]|nr:NAD(P)/FAD-dependent oxidoreductase [Deltaproteobacteria bacterium]